VSQLVVAVAVVVGAVGLGLVLRMRGRVAAPTQSTQAIPSQLDRADFAPHTPWVVAVFSSATCESCADVVRKASVLQSPEVGVVDVEYASARALHRKYDIQAVPIVVIADREGVVRAGFAGPVTAEDLWGALAYVRE
jgi:thioredoxin-related protein